MAWFEQYVEFDLTTLKLAHITDCHLFSERDGHYFGVNTANHFSQCLHHIAQQHVDGIVFGGDLTQDHSVESYELFAQLVAESAIACPVFWLPGNHDELSLLNTLENKQISNAKRIIANGFEVLLINSKGSTPAGWVNEQHLQQIAKQLATSQSSSVIFCHHNPLPVHGYLDKHMLENGPQLLNTLSDRFVVNHLFHGHVHNEFEFQYRDINIFATPASSVQFVKNTQNWQQQNLGPAYRLITLSKYANIEKLNCETEVVWLKE